MSEKSKLINAVLGVIERELSAFGILKNRFVYTYPIDRAVSGWIGLNLIKNRSDGRVGINPIVGLRNEAVESLVERKRTNAEHLIGLPDARETVSGVALRAGTGI
jgi:hypothetical protein